MFRILFSARQDHVGCSLDMRLTLGRIQLLLAPSSLSPSMPTLGSILIDSVFVS